jgi:hypothetical protein
MGNDKLVSQTKIKSVFNQDTDAFVHYFSLLDSKGLASILKGNVLYDEQSKQDWIILFEKQFESFRKNNINHLNPIPGICSGCKKGCSGYTFLDEVDGFYVDIVFEANKEGNIDFTECVNLKNEIEIPNKKEQIFINEKSLNNEIDELPF